MRILVTGGAGFIGSHVVQRLRDDGHQVRVLDALLPEVYGDQPAQIPDDVEFIHGDLRDEQKVASALRGIELVSHQAALVGRGREILDAPLYTGCNDLGTAVLLAEMTRLGTARLVLGSSVVLYGEARYECGAHGPVVPGPRAVEDLAAGRFENRCPECREALRPRAVDETAPADPRSVYALTKLAQEHLAQVWSRETGSTSVALRYHNVYGAGMPMDSAYSGVASTFRSAVAAGVAPEVYEDGAPLRDFIDVRDVAAANAAALSWPGNGFRAFNVATGAPRSIAELAGCLAVAAGAPTPVISGRYRLGDVRHIIASPDRLVRELGWRPAIAFEEGVTEFASAPLRTVGPRCR
jgi:dTDP-L-rhamnose 4-epimerase